MVARETGSLMFIDNKSNRLTPKVYKSGIALKWIMSQSILQKPTQKFLSETHKQAATGEKADFGDTCGF